MTLPAAPAPGAALHSLPLFVRLRGRAVILLGTGEAAAAKRRLLDRAGAAVMSEEDGIAAGAVLAIVVDDPAAVARLKARGVLVNAVDRPDLCDFTLPAIVERAPVIVAIGTGGASAGLAAALRQRLETLLPAGLGRLADALHAARGAWRAHYPDAAARRRAIAAALAAGGPLDPLRAPPESALPGEMVAGGRAQLLSLQLRSPDPDELTLREARALADADRVTHRPGVPAAILDRARADAARIECAAAPFVPEPGLTVDVEML